MNNYNENTEDAPVPVTTNFQNESFLSSPFPVYGYRQDQDHAEEAVPLWLITFTDAIGLMLTFFVMMYAMSTPQEKKWEQISAAMTGDYTKNYTKPLHSGAEDTINIDRISTNKALDLSYLKTMISDQFESQNIKNIVYIQRENSLIVSMPSDVLFDQGQTEISEAGQKVLFAMAGVFSHIKNRIEIIGHTDPRPLEGSKNSPYKSNWELSLARATIVSNILRQNGYDRPMVVRGVSSSRFEELPESISLADRYDRSRRVDIVVQPDSGIKANYFDIE